MQAAENLNHPVHLQIGSRTTELRSFYAGTAVSGMLSWLDASLLREWTGSSVARIEPVAGGVFYLSWPEKELSPGCTLYGVISHIDTQENAFSIGKMICVAGETKITGLEMSLHFTETDEAVGSVSLILTYPEDLAVAAWLHESLKDVLPRFIASFNLLASHHDLFT